MPASQVGTLIIGGGITGTGLAYYLAREGETGILLVEGDLYGSGATAGSFGNVRQQFGSALEVECSRRGLEFWKTAEEVLDSPCPFHEDGYMLMTGNEDTARTLERHAQVQRDLGMTDIYLLSPEEIPDVAPFINPEGLIYGSYTPKDGHVTAQDGVDAYIKAARRMGVEFRQHWPVKSIQKTPGGWAVSGPEDVVAKRVIIAAGSGTKPLLAPFGIDLDMRSAKHISVISEPYLPGARIPTTIDLDLNGFCVEREGESLSLALLGRNPAPESHDQLLEMYGEIALVRAPALAELGIVHRVTWHPILGGDGMPLVGEVDDDLWALAFTGHGVMHAPPIAEALARQIVGRPDPTLDLSEWDVRRTPGERTVLWRRNATS